MANRLTRDQILLRSLALIDSPRLDEKDQPTAGTITAAAISIGWLQDALDLAHNLFPQASLLKSATFNIVAGTGSYTVSTIASDFVIDFKDGVLLPDDKGRLRRAAFNTLLDNARPDIDKNRERIFKARGGLVAGLDPSSNKAMLDAADDDA